MSKDYNPAKVTLSVGGATISGYADGTFISASRDSDDFSDVSGADGEVARAKSNDLRGSIVITLLQTSLSNNVLSGLQTAGTVVPVTVTDKTSKTILTAGEAWILKPADVVYSKDVEAREWTIRCADLDMAILGNPNATVGTA